MDDIDDSDLPLNQQILMLQMDLERRLNDINEDKETDDSNDDRKQQIVFQYLDRVLDEKLLTVEDFGSGADWLNVDSALSLRNHLSGLLVVIDFFTYCCINCLHILPKLKQIESHFESEPVVVIGVHSPKFENEKDLTNVCDAILKYDITHPIANDPNGNLWSRLDIQCWPTLVILGPNSQLLFTLMGETSIEQRLELYLGTCLKYFKNKELLIDQNKPLLPIKLIRDKFGSNLLAFPSKVSTSKNGQLIAISNSRNNSIIIAASNGIVKHIIGGSGSGLMDGTFNECRFKAPNGVFWKGNDTVFVADTDNHAIRRIDLNHKRVTTLAGNGSQSADTLGGKIGAEQGLNSPWDICCDHNNRLFIAMAGSHQIWVLALEDDTSILNKTYPKGCCLMFAGDGNEQNRNNRYPHKASFAQPSGLALDSTNNCLYVADSESSSIRCVDTLTGCVTGVVGGDRNPENLFAFGDKDGKGIECRLQHCIGICLDTNREHLFVADSYNHKVKRIDLSAKLCSTIAGTGLRGNDSNKRLLESTFNEPNGMCLMNGNILVADTNNHCLKLLDLNNDSANEFNLIDVKERCESDSVDSSKAFYKYDSTVQLNPISLNALNELKFKLNFNFGSKYKLTNGVKNWIVFDNPDDSLIQLSHRKIETENLEDINRFSLKCRYNGKNELAQNKCLPILLRVNICDSQLNLCKVVQVCYKVPLQLSHTQDDDITKLILIDLPLDLDSF